MKQFILRAELHNYTQSKCIVVLQHELLAYGKKLLGDDPKFHINKLQIVRMARVNHHSHVENEKDKSMF